MIDGYGTIACHPIIATSDPAASRNSADRRVPLPSICLHRVCLNQTLERLREIAISFFAEVEATLMVKQIYLIQSITGYHMDLRKGSGVVASRGAAVIEQ